MNTLTISLLLASTISVAYSAGGKCAWIGTAVTDHTKEWNYLNGGADWICGACKTNNNQ